MLAIFSIAPHAPGEHLSEYVARVIKRVQASGLPYQLTSMGTLIEGEPQAVFDLIRDCHLEIRRDGGRVSTKVWIDDQVGRSGRLRDKVTSVEEKLKS
jgi:uncharacterized protein (TIGR00106 family)